MINAVGREIPDEILQKMKKPAFTGAYSPKKDVIIRTTAKSRCAAIEKGKTAVVDGSKCIGCGACKVACHFGAINIFAVKQQKTI